MIQRIQTVYLFLSSFLSFFIYSYTFELLKSTIISKTHFFLISSIILFFIIFFFKKRGFQSLVCLFLIILNLVVFLFVTYNLLNKIHLDFLYTIPILIIVKQFFIFLARRSIIRDEKLIRSIDRLR